MPCEREGEEADAMSEAEPDVSIPSLPPEPTAGEIRDAARSYHERRRAADASIPAWNALTPGDRGDGYACFAYCEVTRQIDEHPENLELPCLCALCRSYA